MNHKFKLKQRVAALCMAAMMCCSLFPAGAFAEAPRADADGTFIMEQDNENVTPDAPQTDESNPDSGENTPEDSETPMVTQSADEDKPVDDSTDYTFDGAVLYTDLPDAPTGSYMGSQGLPVATGETKIGISAWPNDQLEESTDSYLSADTLNSDDLTMMAPLLEGTDYAVAPILAQVEYPADGSSLDVVLPNEVTVLNFYGAPADEATRSSLVHSEYTETSAAVMGLYVQADADFSAQLVYTALDGSTLTKALHVVIDRSRTMAAPFATATDVAAYAERPTPAVTSGKITKVEKVNGTWLIWFNGEEAYCCTHGANGQAEPFLVSIAPEQDNNPWGAMATPKDSVMKASDSYQKFTVLDEEIEVYLKITKLDTETGKPVLLPNTAFQIYWLDDNGNYRLENGKPKLVTMTDTVNGHLTKNVDTFYTNEEGILTLPEKLPLGKYRIVETVGPNGFYNEWADSGNYYVDFDISTDRIYKATGDDNEDGMDTLVIGEDYWNEETLGKLTIRKTGETLTGKIETNDLIDPWMTGEADSDFVYTLRPLAGAEYTITAAEDIYTQDRQLDANGSRTLWYAKGDVVAVVTTGDGSADTAVFAPPRTKATYDFLSVIHAGTLGEVSITLPLGSYHVEETKPPYGYVGTTDSYDVTFSWDNQLNDVVMAKSIVKNGDSEQHFDVVRASEASAELAEQQTLGFYNDREHARVGVYKINHETGKYLAGAVFNLYTRDDIYDIDGNKLFSAGDLISTSPETVADGYTYFNCDVPIRGEWYGQSDRLDASTNSGNYFIRELRAPLGYYLNDAEMDVIFTYDGEILQVLDSTCANKPTEMWVSKRDLTNDEELPGATLVIKDAKDNIVDTWVSSDTLHRVTGLHFDEEYTLTEKRPADGYAVADDIVFRLERKTDADGHELDEADVYYLKDKKKFWIIPWEEWELLDDATVIMRDDITRVQISKVDIATGKELPGAELIIKDTDGNTVAQWVSADKPHYIEKLPAGDYTLTEITAPNGYQIAESITFTVLPTGELQTVVMKDAHIPEETPHEDTPSNTPQPTPNSTPVPTPAPASTPTATPAPMPVIPQTGDVFPFALLSAAVFGSIVGFGIFAYKRRKSKPDESEH